MKEPADDEIRRLFEEARRNDEATAPAFGRLLGRGRSPLRPAPGGVGRVLAVAAAAIVLVISIRLFHRPTEIPPASIETWKPPTDFLLEASFTGLFDTTPVLPERVPDYSPLLAKESKKGTRS